MTEVAETPPPPILALNIPCPECKVPDAWYEPKEEGRFTKFSFKCHWCSHQWTSARDHKEEAKRKKK